MTFTSDERREVAERLRAAREFISILPNTIPEQSAYDAFKLILACVGYERGNVFDILADLIDRPTCRNLSSKPADVLLCSECGEHVDIAYVESCDDYHAKYCPNCGAEVKNEVD